jgi:hypothetical protein
VEPAGTDCGTCSACNTSGACVDDLSQDDDCATCKVCGAGGACVNAAADSDPKNECASGVCRTGDCNGNGACGNRPNGTDCGSSCTGLVWTERSCLSGNCQTEAAQDCDDGNVCTDHGCSDSSGCSTTNNSDWCGVCRMCAGGSCGDVPSGDDPYNDCVLGCRTARIIQLEECDGAGACLTDTCPMGTVCDMGSCVPP